MTNNRITGHLVKLLALIGVLCLTACDGGIFGTGDGGTDGLLLPGVEASGSEMPPVDSDNQGSNGSTDGNTSEPAGGEDTNSPSNEEDATPPAGLPDQPNNSADAQPPLLGFDRNVHVTIGTQQATGFINTFSDVLTNDTQVLFLNTTDTAIGLDASIVSSDNTTTSRIGEATVNTRVLLSSINADTNEFSVGQVNDSGVNTLLAELALVSLELGTKTIMIIRSLNPMDDLITLPSVRNNDANATDDASNDVAVRIVAAELIGDPTIDTNFTLVPTNSPIQPQPSEPIFFQPLSYNQPVSNYRKAEVGIYTLLDDQGRYNNIEIDLTDTGKNYTVIIHSAFNGNTVVIDE